jgi:NAD(P)-dependent dehydrogenase (short-subunit alcohol dehydrogenase family)
MSSAIVTGAGQGIGASIAAALVDAGFRVGVLDLDAKAAARVATKLGNAVALTASVTDPQSVRGALDSFGETPDLLVNNAGIVRFGPLVDLSLDDWHAVVDVNLNGCFVTSRAVAAGMLARGSGCIINVTSMNGVAPGPNAGAYGASKAAVALLTQQMALEWGPGGVRVNAVAPGLIDGGMSAPIYADAAVRKAREAKVPLGRLGRPEDVAQAVVYLSSEAASYVTGQNLLVDGGVTMGIIGQLPRPRAVDGAGDGSEPGD